jgi:hypothetical protein
MVGLHEWLSSTGDVDRWITSWMARRKQVHFFFASFVVLCAVIGSGGDYGVFVGLAGTFIRFRIAGYSRASNVERRDERRKGALNGRWTASCTHHANPRWEDPRDPSGSEDPRALRGSSMLLRGVHVQQDHRLEMQRRETRWWVKRRDWGHYLDLDPLFQKPRMPQKKMVERHF